MQFRSTRGAPERVDFSTALLRGLAPDGGLYVPLEWPRVRGRAISTPARIAARRSASASIAPFAAGDRLGRRRLPAIVR
jgi:threonine synthase